MGLGQLFEIKPRCCRGSLLRDELGLRRFETRNDLTYSFPRAPAGALGRLGSPNLTQAGRYFRGNLWPSAIGRKVMRIVHKPVALAWRQRASSALRARAAATLPPAFMNNSHDFCPTRTRRRGIVGSNSRGLLRTLSLDAKAAPASALRVSGLASKPRKWDGGGAPSLPWGTKRAAARGLGCAAAAGFEFFA
jgi:hypothetical protein